MKKVIHRLFTALLIAIGYAVGFGILTHPTVFKPLFILSMIALYILSISSVVKDPIFSTLEKTVCIIAILLFYVLGIAGVGIYSSVQMKKRFKFTLPPETAP